MRKIHTFDIFDTLVARRCVDPINIFLEIERDLNIKNFTNIRKQAELNVSTSSHNLDSIYNEIVKSFGVSEEIADQLKKIEIDYEIKNAVPIQENIDKVRDGDVLVTDMYLPRPVIEAILEKAGLRKQVGLIISNEGKHSGDIWPKLRDSISLEQHLGDNFHSDINNALSNGVFAIHVQNHKLTNIESYFETNGFTLLSRVIRETRLRSCTGALLKQENDQRMLQISCNVPMLIMACAHIHSAAELHGINQILFSSRDCYALEKIYRFFTKFLNWSEQSSYFFTSRLSRLKASEAYLAYFASLNKEKSMVIDMCGTGWSLGQLYSQSNCSPLTYLVHYLNNTYINEEYEKISPFKSSVKPIYLTDDPALNNTIIEMANYTFSGMFLDMKRLEGYDGFIPEFEDPNYPPAVLDALCQIEVGQDLFMDTLKNYDLQLMMAEINVNISKIPAMFLELYKYMSENLSSLSDITDYHLSQDKKSMLRLRSNNK